VQLSLRYDHPNFIKPWKEESLSPNPILSNEEQADSGSSWARGREHCREFKDNRSMYAKLGTNGSRVVLLP
jgi:hypothetical protein